MQSSLRERETEWQTDEERHAGGRVDAEAENKENQPWIRPRSMPHIPIARIARVSTDAPLA